MKAGYDERQQLTRDRAWRRTTFVVLLAILGNAIFGPWGSLLAQAMNLTLLAVAAQAMQGIWGHAYLRATDNARALVTLLAVLVGVSGYTFIEYGVTTGGWWQAHNPGRLVAFVLSSLTLAVVGARWLVDRQSMEW